MNERSYSQKTVLTIGVFDGVHLGHQLLLKKTVEKGKELGATSIAVTFDPLPEEFFDRKTGILLTLPEEKKELIRRAGIDYILLMKFDEALASMDKEEFCRKLSLLNPSAIIVGEDFRFGREASGTVEDLSRFFKGRAEIYAVPLFQIDGVPVKSSYIRNLIVAGDVLEAQRYLGRRYFVEGEVVIGKGLGKALGYPTANIQISERKVLPAPGVYSGFSEVRGKKYAAAIFIPKNEQKGRKVLEAYLFEFEDSIYGEKVSIEFHERVSDVREFSRLEDLQRKIASDIGKVIASILRV